MPTVHQQCVVPSGFSRSWERMGREMNPDSQIERQLIKALCEKRCAAHTSSLADVTFSDSLFTKARQSQSHEVIRDM